MRDTCDVFGEGSVDGGCITDCAVGIPGQHVFPSAIAGSAGRRDSRDVPSRIMNALHCTILYVSVLCCDYHIVLYFNALH